MNQIKNKQTNVQKFEISQDRSGQRIDNFLLSYLKGVPKSRIYKMMRKGEVRINGGRVKPLYKLKHKDLIRIPPVTQSTNNNAPSRELNKVRSLENSVIYESDRLMIINKPTGIAVHGGSGLSFGVIEALRAIRDDLSYLELIHRLDRATSGCLMIAKKRSTLRFIHEQLRERTISKTYHALVAGQWPENLTQVNLPIEKFVQKSGERISIVSEKGKPSHTQFKLIQSFDQYSLIEAKPHTGRTHQIRVHCAASGNPICGDEKYDTDHVSPFHDRLYLHAHALKFKESENSESQIVIATKDNHWSRHCPNK